MPGIGCSVGLRRNVSLIRRGGNINPNPFLVWRIVLVCLSLVTLARAAEPTPEQLEFFEKMVRPVLVERCYQCHSSKSEKLKGGLLLDSSAGVMKGGEDGPILTPGSPEKSKLIEAINYANPDLKMPPRASGGKLPNAQIAALTEWVRIGAPWPKEQTGQTAGLSGTFDLEKRRRAHWAWQPIQAQNLPVVNDVRWPLTPPDYFILSKLENAGLQPAPSAEGRTLIRRLYLDLTGLPPSPGQMDDFLRDPSPQAYEKVVDGLLASPHFGERWARHWLDLVRYAETLGHEFDYPLQNAWRYRDYVIRAFNADVPFDLFVTEHIAGDLLTQPRRHPVEHFNESLIGTGFFWLGQRDHSPVDVRQHQAELIDNQIDVMCKTFLGLTVACARCHDHKFDAISSKDFYALYGVLESSRYAQRAIDPPEQTASKLQQLQELKGQIRSAIIAQWSSEDISNYLMAASFPGSFGSGPQPTNLNTALSTRWSKALAEKAVSAPGHPLYAWDRFLSAAPASPGDFRRQWETLIQEANRDGPPESAADDELFAAPGPQGFARWFADGEAFASGAGGLGDLVVGETNHSLGILHEDVINDSALSRRLEGTLRSPGFTIAHRYAHVLAAGRSSRIRICVDNLTMIRDPIYGGLMKHLESDQLTWLTFDLGMWRGHRAFIELSDLATPDPADDLPPGYDRLGYLSASRVVFSDHSSPPAGRARAAWLDLLGPKPVDSLAALAARYQAALRQALQTWRSSRSEYSAREQAQLAFLDWLVRNELAQESQAGALSSLVGKYHQLEASIPAPTRVPAMTDGDGMDEHVFVRGNYKTPGEVAPRQFLAALSPKEGSAFKLGSGRLELARCLTDSSNPFLARVMVNRVWQHLFGRGIVPTVDDFGALGQPPTHPELLDWLADWYRTEAAWSTKKLIRLLVTSNAYRMASKPADELAEENDPGNLLCHRMPIRRLEGEIIRDAILQVSGRLDDAMFGPSVPAYLTEFMEGRGRPGASGPLDGAGRRSIYLEVRRNFLSPMMRTFDSPVPFSTIGRRTVSNVPAQSLILLNDPFVVAQAQVWARRLLQDKNCSPRERLAKMYLMAFGRLADEDELKAALAFLREQGAAYGLNSETCCDDEKVWADVCHVAFNLKEFIFVK
jgi:hypothetical protein